jgi:hypothetical protein
MAMPDWAVGVNSVILTIALVGGLGAAVYFGYWDYAATIVSLYTTLMTFIVGGAVLMKMGERRALKKVSKILDGNLDDEVTFIKLYGLVDGEDYCEDIH